MRDSITSIPVSEVFEPRDGCPICRMRDRLEERVVEYITGAAMMEPDVRAETNRQGFCITHYRQLLGQRNRLGVALMLESHLAETEKRVFAGLPLVGKRTSRQARSASRASESCFVCSQVEWGMERMLATVCRLYGSEREFRELFEQQEMLCLPHFSRLAEAAAGMDKRWQEEFLKAASALSRRQLGALREDVHHFTEMFDYRNHGEEADWGNSRDSIERAITYLTAREP